MAKTLYEKLWDAHWVAANAAGDGLIYIDRHLVHEVTSPQAFEGLRLNGHSLWRKNAVLAVPDHNVPTHSHALGAAAIADDLSRAQVETLEKNIASFNLEHIGYADIRQGIVHVIGPEQGAILPGMTVVCGDSHTSTHGAFACLAMGIGTSDVEHVLATQCLWQRKMRNMRITVAGALNHGVSAKDVILAIIGHIGTDGGTGYTLEYQGSVFEDMSMEGRMTVCNMSIEAGARAGLMAVDDKTLAYLKDRPRAPKGADWDEACAYFKTLRSDDGAVFDNEVHLDGTAIKPQVTWGTSPEMVIGIDERVPTIDALPEAKHATYRRALAYMDVAENASFANIPLDYVFIGSCTNARIEDLRVAASMVAGEKIAPNIERAMVVPGSGLVRQQAEAEGLHEIFQAAGFEWREAGCSMCLGMNEDQLPAGKRCASTSNRNFEGRQGAGGRTHLASPAMVARAAIAGHFVDVRA